MIKLPGISNKDRVIIVNDNDGLTIGQIATYLKTDKWGYSALRINGELWTARFPNFIKWSKAAEVLYGRR